MNAERPEHVETGRQWKAEWPRQDARASPPQHFRQRRLVVGVALVRPDDVREPQALRLLPAAMPSKVRMLTVCVFDSSKTTSIFRTMTGSIQRAGAICGSFSPEYTTCRHAS